MPETQNSGQEPITPTLFMGLGGAGSRIVDLIAARAIQLPNWVSQLSSLTSFVSIDTNRLNQNQLRNIPFENRINIGAFDKQLVINGYRSSQDAQALQWLDLGYVPRGHIKAGAGQIRLESRLVFFQESPAIRRDLTRIVASMLVPADTWRQVRHFYVYLFATLAGGFGSGSFLSAAYLIQDVIHSIGDWQPCIIGNLLLSTLIAPVVDPKLHPYLHGNTYAALKELEHLTKLNYKQVKDEGRVSEKFAFWHDTQHAEVMEVRSGPFFLSFIYDQPTSFAVEDVERTIADISYLQIFTRNMDNIASMFDNYEQNQQKLARLPADLHNAGLGYTTYFGALGASALILPANDLLRYCALRFAAEALRTQITFGKTSDDQVDDRSRALSQHAVDYSDPEFLRMSEEGRNEAINQSFVNSVREMKRQDERDELKDGFWYRLVESVEEGGPATTDEKGEVQHSESRIREIRRRLAEARRALLEKAPLRERAFTFHREGLDTYTEIVKLLEDDIRRARMVVQEGIEEIKHLARNGEIIADLKLNPIAERYLVLRLQSECQETWIPEAQSQHDAAKANDISNSSVRRRLTDEISESFRQVSRRSLMKIILRNDEAFYRVRQEAHEYYRSVASAARKLFDAEIALAQLRELLVYLQARALQYAAMARSMDNLARDLKGQAEDLREGRTGEPPLALSVEVFETLEKPRRRIWDRVYRDLYIDEGRYLSTFKRSVLARWMAEQLKPLASPSRDDGLIETKSTERIIGDLREALVKLGEERLRGAIFGDGADRGLDLWRGLDMEARLNLNEGTRNGQKLSGREIEEYRANKFKALAEISGVLARLNIDTYQKRNESIAIGRTRFVVHGLGASANNSAFLRQLKSILEEGGCQVNLGQSHDPRIAIVCDVVGPIALYHIRPVTEELQREYTMVRSDEMRSCHLHTDYHWEESLPNLNPMESELEAGWGMNKLGQGLVAGVIDQSPTGEWVWNRNQGGTAQPNRRGQPLGNTLSGTLYRLSEYYRSQDLRKALDQQIEQELQQIGEERITLRQTSWRDALQNAITEIELRQQNGEITQEDVLDRPVLRVLNKVIAAEVVPRESAVLKRAEFKEKREASTERSQKFPAQMMATGQKHVFLSYCRDNKAEVARLHDDLIAAGEAVWWDDDILPGQDWKFEIREAMQEAYAVVLCLSGELEKRIRSGVYPEIRDAIAAYRQYPPGSIYLLPVRLSECRVPPIAIDDTNTLDNLQYIDFFPENERDARLRKLIQAIQAATHHP